MASKVVPLCSNSLSNKGSSLGILNRQLAGINEREELNKSSLEDL
jgi:hypothetical protein